MGNLDTLANPAAQRSALSHLGRTLAFNARLMSGVA